MKTRRTIKEVQMGHALKMLPMVAEQEVKSSGIDNRIAEIVGVAPETLGDWRADYPLFGQQFEEILEAVRARAKVSLVAVLPEAVEVVKGTIRGKLESPLRFDAAHKTIKGFGVLAENPRVALQDNRSINIIVKSSDGQTIIQDLISGVRRSAHRNDRDNKDI